MDLRVRRSRACVGRDSSISRASRNESAGTRSTQPVAKILEHLQRLHLSKDESSMFMSLIFPCSRWQLPKRGPPKHRFRLKRIRDLRLYMRRDAGGHGVADGPIATHRNSRVGPGNSSCDARAAVSPWTYQGSHQAQTPGGGPIRRKASLALLAGEVQDTKHPPEWRLRQRQGFE
jgi:hypothetical protein